MTATGWRWFAAWALAGALGAFTLAAVLSIGIFVAPFAALAIYLVARRAAGPEMFGAVSGAGLIGLLVWALSLGEWDATWWLVAGLALVAAGVVPYAAAHGRPA